MESSRDLKDFPFPILNTPASSKSEGFLTLHMASNQNIRSFLEYLQKTALSLDWKTLKTDLDQGLALNSSIPQGYGLGSSGALVAALYHQYALDKIPVKPIPDLREMIALKKAFAAMESFFHGQSSGLDPLNSYLQRPLLIYGKDRIETTEIPLTQPKGKGAIFILDTASQGETAPLVRLFLEKMKDQKFRNNSFPEFTAQTEHSISRLLGGQWGALLQSVKRLSELSLQHFKPMIPNAFHQFWKSGLQTMNIISNSVDRVEEASFWDLLQTGRPCKKTTQITHSKPSILSIAIKVMGVRLHCKKTYL